MTNIHDPYDDYEYEDEDEDGYPECRFCGQRADLGFDGLCEGCYEEFFGD